MSDTSRTSSSSAPLSRASSQTSLTSYSYSNQSDQVRPTLSRNESHNFVANTAAAKRVCFVGAGYVGGPTAAVMAYCNPDVTVTVVDMNEERIARWQSRHLPIHEPGLDRIVRIARDGAGTPTGEHPSGNKQPTRRPNLFFSTDCSKHISTADVVFLSVNTPTKQAGVGAGAATDISMFEAATRSVALIAKPGAVIVEKSTVPCRTAEMVREILSYHRPGVPFEVLSNPEFLAEGTAIADLLNPSRVLIGSGNSPASSAAVATLVQVYSWVPRSLIVTVDVFSSELSKLVANAMLAQRISSINTVSAICERAGANVSDVARSIGMDPRIGSRFLNAGLGFGGSCFRKDILSLAYLAESMDLPEVAEYWRQVVSINEWQCSRFVKNVIKRLNSSLRGKKVAILGYAFKSQTSDTRDSQAAAAIRQLLGECPAEISIFDPLCQQETIEAELATSVQSTSRLTVCQDAYSACMGATAVLILTEWKQFCYPSAEAGGKRHKRITSDVIGELLVPEPKCKAGCQECSADRETFSRPTQECVNWARVAQVMAAPKWVFDGRGVVNPDELEKLGLRVEAIGRANTQPQRIGV